MPAPSPPVVTFRPLAERDFADLHVRLNRPHLHPFFRTTPISAEEVTAKYGPRVRGEAPAHCHLALRAGRVFGFLQCYRIADWPLWKALTGETQGIGVDLAILDPKLLGKGLGRAMLGAYLSDVAFALYPGEERCLIAHDLQNHAARATSRSVGFALLRHVIEEGKETELLVISRARATGHAG